MFPEVNIPLEEAEQERPTTGRKSFLFDFDKGDFATVDGKLVRTEGLEAVKVWIEKVLRTERFKFRIYDAGDYGITISDFIHSDYPVDFIKTELEREVREALARHPDITGAHSFSFERLRRGLSCEFTADTRYGQIGGVRIDERGT